MGDEGESSAGFTYTHTHTHTHTLSHAHTYRLHFARWNVPMEMFTYVLKSCMNVRKKRIHTTKRPMGDGCQRGGGLSL